MPRRDERVIESVRFIPDGLKTKVLAVLADGCTSALFSYYPDELCFTKQEIVGRTVMEVLNLFHEKDTEYLQS